MTDAPVRLSRETLDELAEWRRKIEREIEAELGLTVYLTAEATIRIALSRLRNLENRP